MASLIGLMVLAVLVSIVPVGGVVGLVLFGVVLLLVGVLFFRFNPYGDVWDEAQQHGVSPWLYVLLITAGAALISGARWLAL